MADPTELQRVLDDALLEAQRLARATPARAARAADPARLTTRTDSLERRLPPVNPGMQAAPTILEAVRESGIPGLWVLWMLVREATIVGSLMWVAIIVQSLGGRSVSPTGPALAALLVRGLWVLLKPRIRA